MMSRAERLAVVLVLVFGLGTFVVSSAIGYRHCTSYRKALSFP